MLGRIVLLTLALLTPSAWAQLELQNEFNSGSTTSIAHVGDGRLFLTTQSGQILIHDGSQILPTPFLDIDSLVLSGGERGLLSVAFHPDYAANGFFYVNYTNNSGDTVIARYQVLALDPNQADPGSASILLTINQDFANHNGGQLQFGPDGYLYVGMGDGGSGGDPNCRAQDPTSLLGKMLRLDVDQNVNTPPFHGIPIDNPFVGDPTTRDEIWALGLRNPWRFSFDQVTGDLYIGDVGQSQWEEVDYQPAGSPGGRNYGWVKREGAHCFSNPPSCAAGPPDCDDPMFTDPVVEYNQLGPRCSITGGYVYRGCSAPGLVGKYIYADFCTGEIWASWQSAPDVWETELLAVSLTTIRTFGEDADGELYAANGSQVVRFTGAELDFLIAAWNTTPEAPCYTVPLNLLDIIPLVE